MRDAARSCVSAAPAVAVVALAWLRLEQPGVGIWRGVALAVLGLAVAGLPRRSLRLAAAVVATFVAVRLAFGVWPPAWGTLRSRIGSGFDAFYSVHLPFDARVQVDMRALALAALFLFALGIALLAAERAGVAAAAVLVVGAGWPATLFDPARGLVVGTGILLAALALLAGLGSRRIPALVVPAAAAVALAALGIGAATAAGPLVPWQEWNPTGGPGGSAGVEFVWNAQYGGLDWPRHATTVLQVQSTRPPRYLRAAVLDDFLGDAWRVGPPRPADALEPPAALRPGNETREVVTVAGLEGARLAGGSIPVRFGAAAPLERPVRGFALLPAGLTRDFRYTVWSWSPQPSAAALRRSAPAYPAALVTQGLLIVGQGESAPPFGVPDRRAQLAAFEALHPALAPYLPLARLAEKVAGNARTPYDAVSDLERWFLVGGGFRYSDHPRVVDPPLVGFVTRTRAGYCQFFAGAMALMLRYLGIPARVAVGFSGGTYDAGTHTWAVTDDDAHAWVEAWFRGYGWLPFDPTPPGGAATRLGGGGSATAGVTPLPELPSATNPAGFASGGGPQATLPAGHLGRIRPEVTGGGGGGWPVALLVLLVLAAPFAAVGAAKEVARRGRRRAADPRAVAAACRAELAAFLLDQGYSSARGAPLRELGALVRRSLGGEPDDFVAAVSVARFAPPARAEESAGEAQRELRRLLRDLRRSLSARERLLGLLSPRSLLVRRPAIDGSASLGKAGS